MRVSQKYIAALGLLICAGLKPLRAQILIPEELQATNNITLLQSAGAKLWVVQLISENSGIFTYSLSGKQGGIWKRLPAFKLISQNNQKNIEFTDVEVFHDRIYLSGSFSDVTSKNNCLIYFDLVKQTWSAPYLFTVASLLPVIHSLTLAEGNLYLGGYFTQSGSTKLMNLAKIGKDFLVSPVTVKTAVGASGVVTCLEADSAQKSLYISGTFRNILGAASTGFSQFRIADSTMVQTPIPYGTNVLKMRIFGSKLVLFTEDSSSKERKIFFLLNGTNSIRASGIDSLYSVVNFFSNKGIIYFTGDAQPELDLRSQGIFRISEVSKTERLYRQFYKINRAEGFEGNIYVYGSFARIFSTSVIYENFNLARIDDNFRRFYGRVFQDNDANGKYNSLTDKLAGGNNVSVFAAGSFQFTIPVEKSGYFTFIIPTKTAVTFKAMVEKTAELKFVSNPYIFRSDTFDEKVVDFAVQYLTPTYTNVRVTVTAAAGWELRKDTSELYVVRVVNTGLVAAKPDVVLSIDGKINGIQATPAPFQIDPGTQTKLTWKLTDAIEPGGESSIMVKLNAPSTNFTDNQQLDFNASIANFVDNNTADNSDTLQQTVTTSVDPNAKFQDPEIPNGETFAWLDPNAGKIEYIIRFTNVTSDTVSNIVVRDTIATPDYVTYIQETGSSHPFTRLVYTNPGLPNKVIVAYTFSNCILSPNPSGNSEITNSTGYIGFKLGLKTNLSSGTDLQNRASIYLDNNEPILTKTVMARVANSSVLHVQHFGSKVVYPNPFDNEIHLDNVSIGEQFTLYSLDGRVIANILLTNNTIDLSSYLLSSGNYLWTTLTKDGKRASGIITKN